MSFTIEDLIEGNQTPVTVKPTDSAQSALDLMVEHDFSQLPVADDDGRPLGMVTSDSILRALSNFGVTIDALRVSSAVVRVHTFRAGEDLFDLLDDLRDSYAALVVDGNGVLTGIVTNYDTAEYFRRRAEDMMLVEDIETTLKDHIQAAFTLANGEVDHSALASAIEDVTDSKQAKYRMLHSVVRHYLTLQGADDPTPKKEWIEEAYSRVNEKRPAKSLDDLTLAEYTSLLLHRSRWPTYGKNFALDSKAIQKLLDDIRETRNILAHFRGEVTPKQRDQLRFCANWLAHHPPAISVALTAEDTARLIEKATVAVREPQTPYVVAMPTDLALAPTDEELTPSDSRYAPLALWLQSQPISQDRVTLSFEQIEGIVSGELPLSARQHRSWWANDSVGHVQSQQWLEVDWRVAVINMTEERVTFARIREREKDYIKFFSALLSDLRAAGHLQSKMPTLDGHSWVNVLWLPADKQLIPFAYSFARGKRFRVELYIDIGDQTKNKRIFDELLTQKDALETAVGEALSWERLNEKRASRIALYQEGTITDKPEQLAQLRTWAANAMIRLYEALAQPAGEALKAVQ